MAKLIKNRKIQNNDWDCLFAKDNLDAVNHENNLIVGATLWKHPQLQQKKQNGSLGFFLDSDQCCDDLPEDYLLAPVIAIHFPVFSDGRGYSIAKDLRESKNYQGELRAVGDVLLDQLHAMERCGFDAYQLQDELWMDKEDISVIEKAFMAFSSKYQADMMERKPIYKR